MLDTKLTRGIQLCTPFVSSPMDTVTGQPDRVFTHSMLSKVSIPGCVHTAHVRGLWVIQTILVHCAQGISN